MKINDIQNVLDTYPVIVGVDWADDQHEAFVYDTCSEEGENQTVTNMPGNIIHWLNELRFEFDAEQILVCMESNDTRLYHTVMWHSFVDLVHFNTDTLNHFRATFTPSGAKNDPTDARLQVELFLTHPTRFDLVKPDKESTRNLNNHAEKRRKLVDQRGDLENSLRDELKKYFPQALELVGSSLHSRMACEFLQEWGTLQEIKQADPEKVRDFYRGYRLGEEQIQKRMERIQKSVPVTDDPAHIQPCKKMAQALAGAIGELTENIAAFDRELVEQMEDHKDASLWKSFPRAGKQLAPRLLTAFGDDRDRWKEVQDVQEFSGMAPVTEQSGNGCYVHWRWMAPKFLMQTFYEYAEQSRLGSSWAEAFCTMKKEQGDDHPTVIRKLAFKWIRIMYRCWMNEEKYSENRYILSLIRSESPVVEYIDPDVIEEAKKKIS
jgi:transposase